MKEIADENNDNQLLRTKEARRVLGVSKGVMLNIIRSGKLRGVYSGSKKRRITFITRLSLEQFLQETDKGGRV